MAVQEALAVTVTAETSALPSAATRSEAGATAISGTKPDWTTLTTTGASAPKEKEIVPSRVVPSLVDFGVTVMVALRSFRPSSGETSAQSRPATVAVQSLLEATVKVFPSISSDLKARVLSVRPAVEKLGMTEAPSWVRVTVRETEPAVRVKEPLRAASSLFSAAVMRTVCGSLPGLPRIGSMVSQSSPVFRMDQETLDSMVNEAPSAGLAGKAMASCRPVTLTDSFSSTWAWLQAERNPARHSRARTLFMGSYLLDFISSG